MENRVASLLTWKDVRLNIRIVAPKRISNQHFARGVQSRRGNGKKKSSHTCIPCMIVLLAPERVIIIYVRS